MLLEWELASGYCNWCCYHQHKGSRLSSSLLSIQYRWLIPVRVILVCTHWPCKIQIISTHTLNIRFQTLEDLQLRYNTLESDTGLREGMLSHSRLLVDTGQIFNCTLGKYLINTTLFLIRIGDDVKGVKSPREKSPRKLLKKWFNQ